MTDADGGDRTGAVDGPDASNWSGAVRDKAANEGGCGVIGIAADERLPGRHMLQSLSQMCNRGNGKGGGVAVAGLDADQLGVSPAVLREDYLLGVAYLDADARPAVESDVIEPTYVVDHVREVPTMDDWRDLDAVETAPPDVVQYFVRPREEALETFAEEHLDDDRDAAQDKTPGGDPDPSVADELVYRTSERLNDAFYASKGDKQAFVLSHGKDLMVLKMVGYGDDVVRYYRLEDLRAHVWIGHHRYPTKGRVWHPGGAHPFVGLHEALVHNGDFANYAAVSEVLAQREIYPQFLTDTEVSVLLFDLLYRVYDYPLEYVIETLAPTTERDFTMLPAEKRRVYRQLQRTHMQGSPDGPWFFLIAQSEPPREGGPVHRLLGITDTSMLRPQVFAMQDAGVDGEGPRVGFAASEKQAIDAALSNIAAEDDRFWPRADDYWNARGGSHTDGGAFRFSIRHDDPGGVDAEPGATLETTDKFGDPVSVDTGGRPCPPSQRRSGASRAADGGIASTSDPPVAVEVGMEAADLFDRVVSELPEWDWADLRALLSDIEDLARSGGDAGRELAFGTLSLLLDRHYPTGSLRRSSLLAEVEATVEGAVEAVRASPSPGYVGHGVGDSLPDCGGHVDRKGDGAGDHSGRTVVVDAEGFPQEGDDSLARELVALVDSGFEHVVVAKARGHRFVGTGLGPDSDGVRVDVFGASGDYLASGIDGAEVVVHGTGQDQLAQIMTDGRLVVHGDVGQTFMYGAEGGEAYVLGDAAGRPLINAVGSPRVVINGTCLDYLAESFMAGDPLDGGGFVVVNGLEPTADGGFVARESPYPGGNLFSLATGGAVYVRDPRRVLGADQLNGGAFAPVTDADWATIEPYLRENERLFGIPVADLLTVDGQRRAPGAVYRKVQPDEVDALHAEEAWVKGEDDE